MVISSGIGQMLEWVKECKPYATTVRYDCREIVVAGEIAQLSLSIRRAFGA